MKNETKISEYRVVIVSFFVDLLDVIMNLSIALLTGSVIMLAEFLQGLADLTATGLLLIGQRQSGKRADKMHPFGYGKEIYFWTLISAIVMMTATATASTHAGWERLIHPQKITHIALGFAALLIAFVTNGYALSLSVRRILRNKSIRLLPSIFLDASSVSTKNALILDLMGTSSAIFGLVSLTLYQLTGEMRFDGLGAIVVGVTTAILALILIIGVKSFLIGRRTTPDIERKIKEAALTIPQVKKILDLRTMQVGSDKLLVNMEVHMQDRLITDELEVLTDLIKEKIQSAVPSVQHVQVELETPE